MDWATLALLKYFEAILHLLVKPAFNPLEGTESDRTILGSTLNILGMAYRSTGALTFAVQPFTTSPRRQT